MLCWVFLLGLAAGTEAQKVVVSEEIPIRAEDYFNIIGQVEDRVVLMTIKNQKVEAFSFDPDMRLRNSTALDLLNRNSRIIGTLHSPAHFYIFTQFRKGQEQHIIKWKYNERLQLADSATVAIASQMTGYSHFLMTQSEDQSKALFFRTDNDVNLQAFCWDLVDESVMWTKNFQLQGNIRQEFRKMLLSNTGVMTAVLEKRDRRFRKTGMNFEFAVYTGSGDSPRIYQIEESDIDNFSNQIIFDDHRKEIVGAGLYYSRSSARADGHYHFRIGVDGSGSQQFEYLPFTADMLTDVSAQNISRQGIPEIVTRDILLRRDGGLVVFSEVEKIYERRPVYSQRGLGRNYGQAGWVDYQLEDVIITAFSPDGKIHWHEVIYKKQYSQDDGAVHSSYFIFESPSFLRILYNDEISNNSTVSEFILAANGVSERKNLLNTAYQNLRLRFEDALQLSSQTLIVPSENKARLNLVKIHFD